MKFCLDCPCNCARLIMDPRTFNVACELGFRISCPVPEHYGGYQHIFQPEEAKLNWFENWLVKIGLMEIIYADDPRYLYFTQIQQGRIKKIDPKLMGILRGKKFKRPQSKMRSVRRWLAIIGL